MADAALRKKYENTRSSLRALPVLILIGVVLAVVRFTSAEKRQLMDVVQLAFPAAMLAGAFGLWAWQSWARIILLVGVGVNLALLSLATVGLAIAGGSLLPVLPALLINAYIFSILVSRQTREIIAHQGNIDAILAEAAATEAFETEGH